MGNDVPHVRLAVERLRATLRAAFRGTGLAPLEADTIADALLDAELCEVPTHGMMRVISYLNGLRSGRYNTAANIEPVHESPAAVLFDGDNALGYLPTVMAVDAACDRAATLGLAVAGVQRTNEFGRAAYYCRRAAERGFIALVCQNTLPMLGGPGATTPAHGNNPLGFAAPGRDGVMFDAAWTPRAGGEIARRRMLGLPIPEEWGYVDAAGNVTTDPNALGPVFPAAGGAKGFGISVMVDLLAGALTGAEASTSVPRDNRGVGVFVLAISPGIFGQAESFAAKQSAGASAVRESGARWPGDRSEQARLRNLESGQVRVAAAIFEAAITAVEVVDAALATELRSAILAAI